MNLIIVISASCILFGHYVLTKRNAAVEYRLACLLLALVNAIFVGASAMYRLLDPASAKTMREVLDHYHETIGIVQVTTIIVAGTSIAMVVALLTYGKRTPVEVESPSHNLRHVAILHAMACIVLLIIAACPMYLHAPYFSGK